MNSVPTNRSLVFWGTGNICRECRRRFSRFVPDIFIDKNKKVNTYEGIEIKTPDEIVDWKKYFVVIMISSSGEVETFLKSKGLIKNIDYLNYRDFFHIDNLSVNEGINRICKKVKSNNTIVGRKLIIAYIWDNRNVDTIVNFWKEFFNAHGGQNYVVMARFPLEMEGINPELCLGTDVIEKPRLCGWNGHDADSFLDYADYLGKSDDKERDIVDLIEEIKYVDDEDKKKSWVITQNIYNYYRTVFELLKPQEVTIWGGWLRESLIIRLLAKERGIKYFFMEYGWIPGTYQFDSNGIAGQSIYAGIRAFPTLCTDAIQLERIKKWIIEKSLDSRSGNYNEKEADAIQSVKGKKIVFLVGMDDYGMAINSKSEFWKKYVSEVFFSSEDCYTYLEKICNKNGWQLVYKPHPTIHNKNDISHKMDSVLHIYDLRVDDIISKSDVVLSISSAVEYKALIINKPVVQLGKSSLSGQGCTYEVNKREDLESIINMALELGFSRKQKEAFDNYIFGLLSTNLWDDLSKKDFPYGRPITDDYSTLERGIYAKE